MASARSASDDLEDANGVKKIRFLLDSGANESMMKDTRWANRTWKSKTEINSVEVTNDLGHTWFRQSNFYAGTTGKFIIRGKTGGRRIHCII